MMTIQEYCEIIDKNYPNFLNMLKKKDLIDKSKETYEELSDREKQEYEKMFKQYKANYRYKYHEVI